MKTLLTGALAVAATAASGASTGAPSPDAVLKAYQAAVGELPSTGTVSLRYAFSGLGLQGVREDIADLKTGAFAFDYAHQTMYLKPATPLPPDIGQFAKQVVVTLEDQI